MTSTSNLYCLKDWLCTDWILLAFNFNFCQSFTKKLFKLLRALPGSIVNTFVYISPENNKSTILDNGWKFYLFSNIWFGKRKKRNNDITAKKGIIRFNHKKNTKNFCTDVFQNHKNSNTYYLIIFCYFSSCLWDHSSYSYSYFPNWDRHYHLNM